MKIYEYMVRLHDQSSEKLKRIHKASGLAKTNVDRLSGAFSALKRTAAGLALGAALFSGAKAAARLGIEMEQTRVSFATFLKSADKGNAVIAKLNEFSNVTPFDNEQVLRAGKSLLAFGVDAKDLEPTLRKIGDISAGTGKDFNELATIFGKARIAGTLMADDINQLTEAGIPVMQEFAKSLGVTEDQVKDMASQGKLKFKHLEEAFANLTGEGGLFFDLMKKQSETVGGKISTFQGKLQLLGAGIGEAFNPLIGGVFTKLIALLDTYKDKIIGYAQTAAVHVGRFLKTLYGQIKKTLPTLKALARGIKTVALWIVKSIKYIKVAIKLYISYRVGLIAFNIAMKAQILYFSALKAATMAYKVAVLVTTKGIRGATIAMRAFNVATKMNPIGLIVGLLATAATAFFLFGKKVRGAKDDQKGFNEEVERTKELLNTISNAGDKIKNLKLLNVRQLQSLKDDLIAANNQLEDKKLQIRVKFKNSDLHKKLKNAEVALSKANKSNAQEFFGALAERNRLRDALNKKIVQSQGASLKNFIVAQRKNQKYIDLINRRLEELGVKTEPDPTTDGGKDLKNGIDTINGGGTKHTNINISVGTMQAAEVITVQGKEEAAQTLEETIQEVILRTLNAANQVATQ